MQEHWITVIVIGLLVVCSLHWGLKKLICFFQQLAKKKQWRLQVDDIVLAPLRLLLWIFAFSFVLKVLSDRFGCFFGSDHLGRICSAATVIALAWFILRWKRKEEHRWFAMNQKNHHIDLGITHGIGRLLTIVVICITAITILSIFGINIYPLLAVGGIGAAAIGFAAKDVIANFFGGLMLFITRPFVRGEEIIIQSQNLQGVIEDIGWYLTTLRDLDKRPVYLPNALFSEALVVNNSRMSNRRILETFSIEQIQTSRVESLIEEVKKCIDAMPQIDHALRKTVSFDHIGSLGLELSISVYTIDPDFEEFQKVKRILLLAILDVLEAKGVKLAVEKTDIRIETKV